MSATQTLDSRLGRAVEVFTELVVDNLYHTHGQAIPTASKHDVYMAICYGVRDYLIERWRRTTDARYAANPKCVYYLEARAANRRSHRTVDFWMGVVALD